MTLIVAKLEFNLRREGKEEVDTDYTYPHIDNTGETGCYFVTYLYFQSRSFSELKTLFEYRWGGGGILKPHPPY
jgi:hypothetical protein